MADKYRNFQALKNAEEGNYEIEYIDRESLITIVAPHGGKIESETTEIAKKIAGDCFNYYSFLGKKSSGNRELHITSHKFDEPKALELVSKSEIVVAIHGCKDIQGKVDYGETIFIGGLDNELRAKLKEALESVSLPISTGHFPGTEEQNICNKGTKGKGVQLELTKAFRDGELCGKFIAAVSACLKTL